MIMEIIMVLCIIIYYITRGCIEGYTFTSSPERKQRRLDNIFINGGGKSRSLSKGIFDYHTWRAIEQAAIIGAISAGFLLTGTGIGTFILLIAMGGSIGWTFFESIINYICFDTIDQDKDFTIGKYTIKVPWRAKYIGIAVGIIIGILLILF